MFGCLLVWFGLGGGLPILGCLLGVKEELSSNLGPQLLRPWFEGHFSAFLLFLGTGRGIYLVHSLRGWFCFKPGLCPGVVLSSALPLSVLALYHASRTASWSLSTWWPQSRRVARPIVWVAGALTAIVLVALIAQTGWVEGVLTAVVVRERAEVKFSPQPTGTTHFTLPEGTLVRVLGHEFGWAQISRADGRSGWLPDDTLRAL